MSHGQSNVERYSSVNKELLQDNLQVKSLILQRLIYDTLKCTDSELHSSPDRLYLEKAANLCFPSTKQIWIDKQKRRQLCRILSNLSPEDELKNAKKQKIDPQTTIAALREGLANEYLAADKAKDMGDFAKAAAFSLNIKKK